MPRPVALITGPTSGIGAGTVINVASVARLLSGRSSTYSASLSAPSFTSAGMEMASMPSFMWLDVGDVVGECMADVARGKVVIIPGLQYKAMTTAGRMVPRNVVRFMTKTIGRGRGGT